MEEALKKAMEQKEEIRVRGDDLQQLVEDAVRKALGGAFKLDQAEASHQPAATNSGEPYPERKTPGELPFPKDSFHSLMWIKGINSIAVNIKMKMGESKRGTILLASSVSGEGTTTLCFNVSRALAKIHQGNVLLMDCNSQHPAVHNLFRTEASPGLTEILMGKINWEDAVRKTSQKNYYILPFGQPLQEPLALIGSSRMEGLLDVLKTDFDYIFLDAPPILASAETEMIVPWVEATVLVIKAHVTRREVAVRAVERLVQHKDFLGAIFNQQEFIIPQFLYKRLK